jgi:hypothetical protein
MRKGPRSSRCTSEGRDVDQLFKTMSSRWPQKSIRREVRFGFNRARVISAGGSSLVPS